MASKSQFECLNCFNLFTEPTDTEITESGVSEIFRKQYCGKLCENEDLLRMEEDKLPSTEIELKGTEEIANAVRTIAGGFKIRP